MQVGPSRQGSRKHLLWVFLTGIGLFVAGCSRESSHGQVRTLAASDSSPVLTVSLITHPDPPRNGDNTVEVALKRPDGMPEGDASVAADFYMPAMPSMNMPEMHSEVTFAHQGGGIYRGDLHLVMAGTWNVSLRVSRAGQVLGSVSYTVIAR